MNSPIWHRFNGGVSVVLALLVFFVGVTSVRAANTDRTDVPAQVPDNERPPADDSTTEGAAAEPSRAPRLQLQDEPAGRRDSDFARRSRAHAVNEEVEERPFWKSWIFWTITGVLVAGVVGMAIYTSTNSSHASLAPCPPDVVVSLGCFGTGR